MSELRNSLFVKQPYIPAVVQHHKSSNGWVIVFYVFNPSTEKLDCRRIKLNRLRKKFRTQLEFRGAMQRMCDDINAKLAGGWSPYGENVDYRLYSPIVDALNDFVAYKEKEVMYDTIRCYRSMRTLLVGWINEYVPGCTCGNFNKQLAVRYMEHRWSQDISARTYNNNIKTYRCMFDWLMEHCYVKENPFALLKTKAAMPKKRDFIPVDVLMQIFRYCKERCPNFYLVLLLVYYSGLRPGEVMRLRVRQFDFEQGVIRLEAAQTKNHKDGVSNLSAELVELLRQHFEGARPSDYVFGDFLLNTGKMKVSPLVFRKFWNPMHKALNLPSEYQLYSLRDSSGVHRYLNGANSLDIMHSLRHSSLDQTTIYTDHIDDGLHDRLEKVTPHL